MSPRCTGPRVKQKVLPRPSPSDSTQIRPPCISTMRSTTASPMPVPCPALERYGRRHHRVGRQPARGAQDGHRMEAPEQTRPVEAAASIGAHRHRPESDGEAQDQQAIEPQCPGLELEGAEGPGPHPRCLPGLGGSSSRDSAHERSRLQLRSGQESRYADSASERRPLRSGNSEIGEFCDRHRADHPLRMALVVFASGGWSRRLQLSGKAHDGERESARGHHQDAG